MYASARKPVTATRKNMKRIMTKEQFRLLRNRNIIETVDAFQRFAGLIQRDTGTNSKHLIRQ